MRKVPGSIHWASGALALVLLWSCKEDASKPAEATTKPDSVHRQGKPASDSSFSPAEIRRSGPSLSDTSAHASATKPDSASAPEQAAKPVAPVEKPIVPEKAPVAPAPAKPVETAQPPAVVPVKSVSGGEAPGPEGEWVLQINIHKSEAEARAQVQKLADQGISAYAIPVPTGETRLSGDYWRVRVGRFKDRAKAQAWGEANIVSRGLKFWVDKKSNENRSAGNP
ncbi:MAG: SPOR domain-containing protein [Fibrobacteres bacterium]|nr:SPOR domain-containing protein [Fibrobacterota bacterium]